jgi:hypothetical protein
VPEPAWSIRGFLENFVIDKFFMPISEIPSIVRGSISLYPVVAKFESTRNFRCFKYWKNIV